MYHGPTKVSLCTVDVNFLYKFFISDLHVFICVLVKYVCLADLCAVGSVDKQTHF